MQKIIKGIPGSSGIAKGVVKVVLSMDDFSKFEPGDILVTEATTPIWTPLMSVASAVVTNIGGALSHAAIVCREMGIPAVVGTQVATLELKDSMHIEVNGSSGEVIVL